MPPLPNSRKWMLGEDAVEPLVRRAVAALEVTSSGEETARLEAPYRPHAAST